MDAPGEMYYFQMLMLLLLMGICTFWLGRMLQWLLLRRSHPQKKILFILAVSLLLSYLIALLAWFCWPHLDKPMWGIFFLPAVLAEVLILIITIVVFKKRKHT